MDLAKQGLAMQCYLKSNPLVAVFIVTYNHEKYISQALDSVLTQRTKFLYKIFLGEDCSTDNTRNICIEYAKNYPDRINLFLNTENDFKKNLSTIYNACFKSGSKYVAMLDGDDYWTDPKKLQKQVEYLDENPDFSLCFHQVGFLKNNRDLVNKFIDREDVTNIFDLAKGNFIHTSSVLFRNVFHKQGLPKVLENNINDYILFMCIAKFGKIKELRDIMAVYRVHNNGLWSGSDEIDKLLFVINSQQFLLNFFNEDIEIKNIIREQYLNNVLMIAELCNNTNEKHKNIKSLRLLEGDVDFLFKRYIEVNERQADYASKLNSIYFLFKRIIFLVLERSGLKRQ